MNQPNFQTALPFHTSHFTLQTLAQRLALPMKLVVIGGTTRQSSIVYYFKRRVIQANGSAFNSIWPALAKLS